MQVSMPLLRVKGQSCEASNIDVSISVQYMLGRLRNFFPGSFSQALRMTPFGFVVALLRPELVVSNRGLSRHWVLKKKRSIDRWARQPRSPISHLVFDVSAAG